MWKPREGTEAHAVDKEVERRKKTAVQRGLDKLFSETYHDCLENVASWIKSQNKRYVHPAIIKATEGTKDGENFLEFVMNERKYRITSREWYGYARDDKYNDLALFLDGKKLFAISESVTSDEWATYYSSLNVKAYVTEDWVSDFRDIQKYKKAVDEQAKIEYAEDPTKVAELKRDFGIESVFIENRDNKSLEQTDSEEKGTSGKIWWVIIIIIILSAIFGN
jgi:hypothetical protein